MGFIYLYTGNGAGKTTNALGLALRAVGHGLNAVIIQFMKGRKDIGEYKVKDRLTPQYEIYQFGTPELVDLKSPSELDRRMAEEGLRFAEEILRRRPTLLVLDEINLAVFCGLLDVDDVLGLLDKIPEETTVVLTGRYAVKELYERADFVNEIVDVKHPPEMITVRGIQY